MKNKKGEVIQKAPKTKSCSKEFKAALKEVKREGKSPLIVVDASKFPNE